MIPGPTKEAYLRTLSITVVIVGGGISLARFFSRFRRNAEDKKRLRGKKILKISSSAHQGNECALGVSSVEVALSRAIGVAHGNCLVGTLLVHQDRVLVVPYARDRLFLDYATVVVSFTVFACIHRANVG